MAGTVTALEIQKRNKERVNVYLDGDFAFGLPLWVAAELTRGTWLSDDEIERLKALDEVARAKEAALRILALRPRSVAEVQRHLKRKGFSGVVIDQVVARFTELGYLDDEAFARYWVENRETFRPRGPLGLRQELRQKGVPEAIIRRVVSEVDVPASARRALLPQARRWRHLDWAAFRRKAGQYLARRGFPYDVINDVVPEVWAEVSHGTPDQDGVD